MPLGCRANHIVWHQNQAFPTKNISQSWLTFNFFSRHLLQVLRMLHLNSQLTCILVITKKITIVLNGKYGERSQTSCAQIVFQCLFKGLKHSFKNHKDGYTCSSAFRNNFLSEEI